MRASKKRTRRWVELDRVLAKAMAATPIEAVAAAVDQLRLDAATALFGPLTDAQIRVMLRNTVRAFTALEREVMS